MLKRYELLNPIGTGGMGHVYRARIKGPVDVSKLVAVKVMHPHLARDVDFVSMFLDEMRVAMALDHRNIVKTFDADHVNASYFIVMELVEGCSLRQLLTNVAQRGVLIPLDVGVFVGMEISAALEFAHRPREALQRGGVLHRDVSPSNILLASEGDVKLADFGIAKAAGARYVTSANIVRGKRQYMSAEHARGEATPQSDLYALGAVLYEAMTGVPVPQQSGFQDWQSSVLPVSPKTIRRDIPDELATVILSCLEPDAKARISSAAEVRKGLASVAFELQGRVGAHVDPHASLRSFLEQHTAPPKKEIGGATAKREVEGFAAVLLEQVQAVETDPNFKTEPTTPMTPRGKNNQSADAADPLATRVTALKTSVSAPIEVETNELERDGIYLDTTLEGGPGAKTRDARRRLGLVAALLLIGSAAAALAFYAFPGNPRAVDVTPTQDHIARAERGPGFGPADTRLAKHYGPTSHDASTATADSEARLTASDGRSARPKGVRTKKRRRKRKRSSYGLLDINSTPWSQVYIDGRLRGETPLQRVRLDAGPHRVRLVSPKRERDAVYLLTIRAGQRMSKVYELPAK